MVENKTIEELATIMKIALTEEEVEALSEQLTETVDYIEMLHEVNTDGVAPTYHGTVGRLAKLRADEPKDLGQVDQLLEQAEEVEETLIKVPAILEDGEGGA